MTVGADARFGVTVTTTAVAAVSAAIEAAAQSLRTAGRRLWIGGSIAVPAAGCCCSLGDGDRGGWCDRNAVGLSVFIVRVLVIDELMRRPYEPDARCRVGQNTYL
jgi:hypothetical protein